jgi:hypothetical protein
MPTTSLELKLPAFGLVFDAALPDEVVPDELAVDVPDALVPGAVERGDVAIDSAATPENCDDEVAGAVAGAEDEAVATACAPDANATSAGVNNRGSRDGLRMAVLLSDRFEFRSAALQCVCQRPCAVRRGRVQSSNSAGQSSSCRPGASSSLDQRACRQGSKSETGMPSSSISRRGGSFALRGSILAFGFMDALSSAVNLHRI